MSNCNHQYKTYVGFTDRYEYCQHCDKKRSEIEAKAPISDLTRSEPDYVKTKMAGLAGHVLGTDEHGLTAWLPNPNEDFFGLPVRNNPSDALRDAAIYGSGVMHIEVDDTVDEGAFAAEASKAIDAGMNNVCANILKEPRADDGYVNMLYKDNPFVALAKHDKNVKDTVDAVKAGLITEDTAKEILRLPKPECLQSGAALKVIANNYEEQNIADMLSCLLIPAIKRMAKEIAETGETYQMITVDKKYLHEEFVEQFAHEEDNAVQLVCAHETKKLEVGMMVTSVNRQNGKVTFG